jgi:hypothetical protein
MKIVLLALLLAATAVSAVGNNSIETKASIVPRTKNNRKFPERDVKLDGNLVTLLSVRGGASKDWIEPGLSLGLLIPIFAGWPVRGSGETKGWQPKAMWWASAALIGCLGSYWAGLPVGYGQPKTESQKIMYERVGHTIGLVVHTILIDYYSKKDPVYAKEGGFLTYLLVNWLRHLLEWTSHELASLAVTCGFQDKLFLPTAKAQNFFFLSLNLVAIPLINGGTLFDMVARIKKEPLQMSFPLLVNFWIMVDMSLKGWFFPK